jgi:two-component system, chemotaxis family, sensor kinase Cph1
LLDEIQQFLQSAVHDLRAAQRRTAIAAELLLQAATDKERTELTSQMLRGLSRTEELLAGLSSYAIALTPKRYGMAVFPSGRAVRFALANLDGRIRETGATITVSDLPEISGDRDRLAELFEHLIGNSLKFRAPDKPVIDIGAVSVPEGWQFSVTDNGVGIAPQYRDRLFVPFRRLQGTDIPGAGLGLAISRKIVEAHGGRIWIEPREGPGVTFSFILPSRDGG